ncbi:mercuric transporter MerT family protein [Tautonia sociabilis]|uniref:Mercuric transport protein MerT n=1 Tax=Tautonia sociabilis TaxID=2080755 RepID=A0A432MDV6_9BACT|nr:mercuric transporter MerT family protein [Tautonia sociabilis]RUL83173.1 Mercuric transport protein MerT [Tautonia sociabilis]
MFCPSGASLSTPYHRNSFPGKEVQESGRRVTPVYLSETSDRTFLKSQLRVPVGVKEKAGDRPLCYCFGHSVASIKEEFRTKGHSDALQDIRAKMKDPGCRCETENPSGACCLGSVTKGIKIAQEELTTNDSEIGPVTTPLRSPSNRGERIAKIGTVFSAIMASACCWLPLLLLTIGVSGVGIAATLETYRPLFIVVTFGFLAAAFYFAYRPKKSASRAAHDCCPPVSAAEGITDADCCDSAQKGRFSMVAMNKVMLWAVTFLAVAFLLLPNYVGALIADRESSSDTVTESPFVTNTTIAIDGMTCEGCAVALEGRLKDVPGVLNARVDYAKKQAILSTKSCCPFPKDDVFKAIAESGFAGHIQ